MEIYVYCFTSPLINPDLQEIIDKINSTAPDFIVHQGETRVIPLPLKDTYRVTAKSEEGIDYGEIEITPNVRSSMQLPGQNMQEIRGRTRLTFKNPGDAVRLIQHTNDKKVFGLALIPKIKRVPIT